MSVQIRPCIVCITSDGLRRKWRRASTHNRSQSAQRSTDSQTAETTFGDGCVNDPLVAEPIQQALGDLVGTVVLGDLFSQDEDLLILLQLLDQGLVQGLADGVLLGALDIGEGSPLRHGEGRGQGRCESRQGSRCDGGDAGGGG